MRKRLQMATRSLHDEVETTVDFDRRLARIETYIDLLQRLYAIHAGFEQAFLDHDFALFGLDMRDRARSSWLVDDITALTGKGPVRTPSHVRFATIETALGAAYVIEGSTLGGQVLAKRAIEHIAVTRDSGARFFHGHGFSTGSMWVEFLGSLTKISPAEDKADNVEHGAILAFHAVLAGFVD